MADSIPLDLLTIDDTRKVKNEARDDDDAAANVIEAVPSGDTMYKSAMKFEDLNLSSDLLKGLYVEMKFEKPSKIQAVSLPMILTPPYKNLVAQAHNGSGKTTCFVLGMLSRIDTKISAPQALCICPTRELAIQNMEVLLKMGRFTGIKSELAIRTDAPVPKRLPISAQVVIGTPGTISHLITAKKLSMAKVKILVFDEADQMLAVGGFRDESRKIMKSIVQSSPDCQVLLFSATFNDAVRAFADQTIREIFRKNDYNKMFVKKEELSLASVKQYRVNCPDEDKKIQVVKDKILELGDKIGQSIIFVHSRRTADMLQRNLVNLGYEVTNIHGGFSNEMRDKIIKEFKEGITGVLIATNLLSRGFDQMQVNLVVNYDLPVVHDCPSEPDYEVYMHRVGRAGRFGSKGAVFNLLCGDRDKQVMRKIEEYFHSQITEVPRWNSEEDFEAALSKAGLI